MQFYKVAHLKGYKIHIYKDGEEIPGSPFNSYRQGGEAIGLISVSSIKTI